MRSGPRSFLIYLIISLGVAIAPLLFSFDRAPSAEPTSGYVFNDFFAFYSAATYLGQGGDPYDHVGLSAFRSTLGHDAVAKPLRSLYPPWFFNLSAAFSKLQFFQAYSIWLGLGLFSICMAAWLSWRELSPQIFNPLACLLLALTALPIIDLLFEGQSSWILVLGLGLIYYGISSAAAVAGVGIFLLSLKPHLFLPLGALLLIRMRDWQSLKPIIIGAGLFAVASLITELRFPGIHASWWQSVSVPPLHFKTPSIAYNLIRLLPDISAVLIVSTLALTGIVAGNLLTKGKSFRDSLIILLPISLIVAPYCWISDFIILVIPHVMLGALAESASDKTKAKVIYLIIAGQIAAILLVQLFVKFSYQLWWYPLLIGAVVMFSTALIKSNQEARS